MTFKVLHEEPYVSQFTRPNPPVDIYRYKCEITSFPYKGRIKYLFRRESLRFACGEYAGKIVHKKTNSFSRRGKYDIYDELTIRTDI